MITGKLPLCVLQSYDFSSLAAHGLVTVVKGSFIPAQILILNTQYKEHSKKFG